MGNSVARRSLLQAGAIAGSLAAIGFGSREALAAEAAPVGSILFEGMIVAHIRLDCRRGATIDMMQLDSSRRPVQQLGRAELSLSQVYGDDPSGQTGDPVGRLCLRAEEMARTVAARAWGISTHRCRTGPLSLKDPELGRQIGYRAWVDVV